MLRETILDISTQVMSDYQELGDDEILERNIVLLKGFFDVVKAATTDLIDDIEETISPLQNFLGNIPWGEAEEIQAMYDNLPPEMQEVADKLFEAGPDAVDLFLQAIFEVDPELIEEVVAETGHTMADFHAMVGR